MVSIKKILLLFFALSFCGQFSAQERLKNFGKILRSTSIYEIDGYLRVAHPDDPKRSILKPRLIEMLQEYIRTAHPADVRVVEFQEKIALLKRKPSTRISYEEMTEIIKQKQIAKYLAEMDQNRKLANGGVSQATQQNALYETAGSPGNIASTSLDPAEQEEFKILMTPTSSEQKNKTVNILNSLFDNDPNSKESIVLIENKSDCNMIVRIEGVGNANFKLAVPSKSENSIVVPKGDYLFSSIVCGAQYASQKTVQKAIMVSLGNPGK